MSFQDSEDIFQRISKENCFWPQIKKFLRQNKLSDITIIVKHNNERIAIRSYKWLLAGFSKTFQDLFTDSLVEKEEELELTDIDGLVFLNFHNILLGEKLSEEFCARPIWRNTLEFMKIVSRYQIDMEEDIINFINKNLLLLVIPEQAMKYFILTVIELFPPGHRGMWRLIFNRWRKNSSLNYLTELTDGSLHLLFVNFRKAVRNGTTYHNKRSFNFFLGKAVRITQDQTLYQHIVI